jgi:D-inositol-3-phosphate glycosyltransferase
MKRPTRKVALVVPSVEDYGGVITVARFLLQTMQRSGDYTVKLISLATSSRDPCSMLLTRPQTWRRGIATRSGVTLGETFVHVGASIGEFEFRRYARRRALNALIDDCDLVQVVAGVPAWAWPVARCGKPVVLQVATLTKVERRSRLAFDPIALREWRRVMTSVTAGFDTAALRAVDAVMVENQWMLDYVRKVAANTKVMVQYAPPGVNTRLFHQAVTESSGRPYVMAVGRFSDPRKNADLLLDSFAQAQARAPALCLVVIDPDGPGDRFQQKVNELKITDHVRILLRSSDEDLASLYRSAMCVAVSSDEEGFGMVVIEAMASGTPVVSTRCGGPDGIITDGHDGFLVPVGDASALADRIGLLAGHAELQRKMGANALATVNARFSEEKAGQAFLSVYDTLLSNKAAAAA